MLGSSRGAFAAGRDTFAQVLQGGVDRTALADELLAVSALLDGNVGLRRALADPTREAAAKRELVRRLFGDKLGAPALSVLRTLAGGRWANERDFADAVESLAVEAVVVEAETAGRLDELEDELFRFGRVVSGSPELRAAVSDRARTPEDRAELVTSLLSGKATPEALRLARQAVLAPRGRKFDRVMEDYQAVAAKRREQLTATVTSAVPLDQGQRERLAGALGRIYGDSVQLNVVLDPEILGGIRVQIGDEVVDGTILRRLDDARRRLAG